MCVHPHVWRCLWENVVRVCVCVCDWHVPCARFWTESSDDCNLWLGECEYECWQCTDAKFIHSSDSRSSQGKSPECSAPPLNHCTTSVPPQLHHCLSVCWLRIVSAMEIEWVVRVSHDQCIEFCVVERQVLRWRGDQRGILKTAKSSGD